MLFSHLQRWRTPLSVRNCRFRVTVSICEHATAAEEALLHTSFCSPVSANRFRICFFSKCPADRSHTQTVYYCNSVEKIVSENVFIVTNIQFFKKTSTIILLISAPTDSDHQAAASAPSPQKREIAAAELGLELKVMQQHFPSQRQQNNPLTVDEMRANIRSFIQSCPPNTSTGTFKHTCTHLNATICNRKKTSCQILNSDATSHIPHIASPCQLEQARPRPFCRAASPQAAPGAARSRDHRRASLICPQSTVGRFIGSSISNGFAFPLCFHDDMRATDKCVARSGAVEISGRRAASH